MSKVLCKINKMKLFSDFCDIKKCLNLQEKSRTLKKQKSRSEFQKFDCNVVSVFVGTENFFSHDIKNTLRENKETVKISIAILLHL